MEDWAVLSEGTQQLYKCNSIRLQNDFHYIAGLLLARFSFGDPIEKVDEGSFVTESETDSLDSVEQTKQLGKQPLQNEVVVQPQQVENTASGLQSPLETAAKLRFGNLLDSSAAPFVNETQTTTAAASSVEQSVTAAAQTPMQNVNLTEPMDTSEVSNPSVYQEAPRLVLEMKDDPEDRAGTKPLEMPPLVATKGDKRQSSNNGAQSFASLTFQKKFDIG